MKLPTPAKLVASWFLDPAIALNILKSWGMSTRASIKCWRSCGLNVSERLGTVFEGRDCSIGHLAN